MKSICFITGMLLAGVLVTNISCDDYLDAHPDNIITLEMIFDSEPRVQEWLAGIYAHIVDPTWTEPHDYGYDVLADDMQIPEDWRQFNWWPMDAQKGNWSPSTYMFNDYWTGTYRAVRAAHIFLNRVKALPSQYLSQEDVDMMKLEARFLVAYFYSYMLELYGSFPLIDHLFESEAALEEVTLPRTTFEDIVAWLDREFTDLAGQLPESFNDEATRYGRPTKGMALACRARVWLFAASPLFNGNPLLADLSDKDGVRLFPAAKDPKKWEKAKEATEELLALGRYELYVERFTDGEIDPFLSFQNTFLKGGEQNREIIFAVPNNGYANRASHSSPKGNSNGGNDGYSVTQQLVDAFFTKNGLPTGADPEYQSGGYGSAPVYYPHTAYDLSTPARTGGLITPAGTFNMYVNREPRFYITVTYNGLYIPSYGAVTEFFDGGRDGKNSGWDYPPTGYLNRKKVHPEDAPRTNTYPYRPGIAMRLAEFYLNYAEILNEISYDTHQLTVIDYLNRIRKRAGIPLYGNNAGEIAVPANYDAMKTAIRRERRVELAMEGIRYKDMRRWLIGKELYDDQPITGMNTDGRGLSEFYANPGKKVFLERHWDDKMYLWPIPQSAMDKNARLIQNPGWPSK